MNNEPVAWIDYLEHSDVYDLNVSGRGIPLYTHPAQKPTMVLDGNHVYPSFKELSDEEIMEVIEEIECTYNPVEIEMSYDYEVRLARAILRKASEK